MFTKNDEGRWCIFGLPIVGGIFPFIGFREFELSDDEREEIEFHIGAEVPKGSRLNFFCIEWLGFGARLGKAKRDSLGIL